MRKRSFMPIRLLAALLALLLVVLSLPVVPAQAAPEASGISADDDDISVLSVIVNTNTETNEVFTELILQNNGAEDKQITFPLPEVYAGVNVKTLTVKTANGEELVHDSGTVTLDIQAGGFAGVSYTYKTKKNLVYEHLIGFDLKQLSALFSDRIGHLEWTVDMPLYELVLVNDIQPVNYRVTRGRISVTLDDFPVSKLLDQVLLLRTTHADLLEESLEDAEQAEAYREKFNNIDRQMKTLSGQIDALSAKIDWDNEEPEDVIEAWEKLSKEYYALVEERNLCSNWLDIHVTNDFVIKNYRNWYRDSKYVEEHLVYDPEAYYLGPNHLLTVLNMYFEQYYPEDREDLIQEMLHRLHDSDYEWQITKFDKEQMEQFYQMGFWGEHGSQLFEYLLFDMGLPQYTDYVYYITFLSCPAILALRGSHDPQVYAIVPSAPGLEGKDLYTYDLFGGENIFYSPDVERLIYDSILLDEAGRYRKICLLTSDLTDTDPTLVRDTLDALHVRAVIRYDLVWEGREIAQSLPQGGGDVTGDYRGYFAYDGTDTYPHDSFSVDLMEALTDCVLLHNEEPFKDFVSIPFFTQYWGIALEGTTTENMVNYKGYSRQQLLSDGKIDALLNHPIPKQMLAERDAKVKQAVEENDRLIAQAYAELNMPEVPEAPTEAPTEVPTEAPTEVTTETTVPVSTEEKLDNTTQAVEESTLEVSTEEPARGRGEKETKESSDKNVLVIVLIVVGAVVALAAALTAILVIQKKKKS